MASEARATAMELVRAWGAGDLKNNLFLKENGGGDVAAVDRVRHDGLCAVEEPSSVHQPRPTTCNPFPPPLPCPLHACPELLFPSGRQVVLQALETGQSQFVPRDTVV